MEHPINKHIHLDSKLFTELLHATSENLSIPIQIVEKDYYISGILRALSMSTDRQKIVFKGGTSLSKAYHLIDRFSEDIDFAVITKGMSGNQVKMIISKLMKEITSGFPEDTNFSDITKGSKYREQAFLFETKTGLEIPLNPISSRIIVEISAFANPFPYEKRMIEPFVTTFLRKQNMPDVVTQYQLEPFKLNVLSLRQTLCEKTASLIRFSMGNEPLLSLSSKVRHFNDLNALLTIKDLGVYVSSKEFLSDMQHLVNHDQNTFDEPAGWKNLKEFSRSPLLSNFDDIWKHLAPKYEENLSAIAYREIPPPETIRDSILKILNPLRDVIL